MFPWKQTVLLLPNALYIPFYECFTSFCQQLIYLKDVSSIIRDKVSDQKERKCYVVGCLPGKLEDRLITIYMHHFMPKINYLYISKFI